MQNFFPNSYLATGDSFNTLAYQFRLGASTVRAIVKETCYVIWEVLSPSYLPEPNKNHWRQIVSGFWNRWDFPNCIGALDGKHVILQAPPKSGSLFFNYKGSFSINLMALVDHDYRLTYIDIGQYGSNSDRAVFKDSEFGTAFMNDQLDVPDPIHFPNFPASGPVRYCFVADEAFPLRCDLMRPFPRETACLSQDELVFNYRLSRARRIVENAFGILVQRWRIFSRKLNLLPDNVDSIIKACVVLNNFLRGRKDLNELSQQLNPDNVPFLWDDGAILDLDRRGYKSSTAAKAIRNIYKNFFRRPEGQVTWQDRAIAL